MDLQLLHILLLVVLPVISGMVVYIMRNILTRIEELEHKSLEIVSETDVRQILADKLDPIHDDLKEIKDSLKQLYNLFYSGKH